MRAVSMQAIRRWAAAVLRYITSSDYLAATVAMSTIGVARDGVNKILATVVALVVQRLWVTIRLEEKDTDLVLAWLREQPGLHRSSQLTLYSQQNVQGLARTYEYEPEIEVTTRLRYFNKGSGRWIWITKQELSDGDKRRLPGATVSFLGRDKNMLEAILESGREIQRRRREKYLTVVQVYDYGKDHGLNWLHPQDKDRKQPGRSISSVVLPRCPHTGLDQAEALLEDARDFLASELWYTERGIPYRRGYLLHGIPGGGKSSLVMAVASELRLPIYMLQLSSELMSDDTLNSLLKYGMHDPPTILLLEDVDLLHSAVLHRRSKEAEGEMSEAPDDDNFHSESSKRRGARSRLTLSGLLNGLDGPTATSGRLLFMTTNAKDRLDPALLRSGRIDYEVEFREVVPEQTVRLFARFYADFRSGGSSASKDALSPSVHASNVDGSSRASDTEPAADFVLSRTRRSTSDLAKTFAEKVHASGVRLTSADIQRHLMKWKQDPERALQDLPTLLQHFKPSPESPSKEREAALDSRSSEADRKVHASTNTVDGLEAESSFGPANQSS